MSSSGGGGGGNKLGEYWKSHQSSPVSRLVNPELHVKPNKLVAALGTGAFLLIVGNLAWIKYGHEKKLAKSKIPPQRLENIIRDDD